MLDFVHCAGNTIVFWYVVGFDIILHYLSEENENLVFDTSISFCLEPLIVWYVHATQCKAS